MRPVRLRARNLRTYPDLDLEFGAGLVGILGELRGASDSVSSNGSGKSTILEAIDLALFGRRSLAGYLTRGGAVDELMVELTFMHGNEEYRVRRTYSAKGRGKTSVDFEMLIGDGWTPLTCASAKETDDKLCSIIGLSRETFRDSAYLRQGDGGYADPDRDPRQRKQLLVEAVLGRDPVWPRLADIAKTRRKVAEQQIERKQGEGEGLRELAEQAQPAHLAARRAADDVAAAGENVAQAEERHQTIAARYQQAREAAHARQTLEAELRQASAVVVTLQERQQQAEQAATDLAAAQEEIATLATAEHVAGLAEREVAVSQALDQSRRTLDALVRQKRDYQDAIHRRADILDRHAAAIAQAATLREKEEHVLAHVGDARCDRCAQTLGVEAADAAAQSFRDEADLLDRAAVTLAAEADATAIPTEPGEDAKLQLSVEVNGLESDLRSVRAELVTARESLQKRAGMEERIRQLSIDAAAGPAEHELASAIEARTLKQRLLDDLEPVSLEIIEQEGKAARVAVETARTARENAVAAKARADERLTQTKIAADKIAGLAADIDALQATVDRDLLLERAAGRDGIPALIIENTAIPAIEAEASRILHALGTGFQVELRTQAETKTGGLRDTLDVVVIDEDGNECEYETGLSEGQKTRVALALRIGLARLLRHRTGGSDMFALDEPSYLDAAGMVALLSVLRDLEASGEFALVFLVSHVAELRDSLEQTITVVQENGVSRIDGARVLEGVAA